MPRHCLDANVFIEAKKGPYGMDFVPAFWDWLDRQVEAAIIYSSTMVYDELSAGNDELARWARQRKNSGLFEQPTAQVQQVFQTIANFVGTRYPQHEVEKFLNTADPWIIAHAMNNHSIVVTHETMAPTNSQRIKIPNICHNFGVSCIGPYQMLRQLGARFIL
jgi:predicted nucleic acid-binding protein